MIEQTTLASDVSRKVHGARLCAQYADLLIAINNPGEHYRFCCRVSPRLDESGIDRVGRTVGYSGMPRLGRRASDVNGPARSWGNKQKRQPAQGVLQLKEEATCRNVIGTV